MLGVLPFSPTPRFSEQKKNAILVYFCRGAAGSVLETAAKKNLLLGVWAHEAFGSLRGTDAPEGLTQLSPSTQQSPVMKSSACVSQLICLLFTQESAPKPDVVTRN